MAGVHRFVGKLLRGYVLERPVCSKRNRERLGRNVTAQQPEALRLADALDELQLPTYAAELRRLSAQNEYDAAVISQRNAELSRRYAINAQLLEALELIASTDPVDAALDPQRAVRVARATIAAAKENT
jgi:hypothetical protein